MHARTRLADPDDVENIVALSAKVQNVISASGSKQVIGPLRHETVKAAVMLRSCHVVVIESPEEKTKGQEMLCGLLLVKRVVDVDDFPCGSGAASLPPSITNMPQPWSFLHSIMIDFGHQRKGLGTRLVKAVLSNLSSSNVRTVFLDCWEGAEQLRTFYERLGFTLTSIVPEDDYRVALYCYSLHQAETLS